MNLFNIYNFLIGLSIYVANGQTPNRKEDEWYKEQWPAQPYAFGYEIRDYSGNEQYRKEMSDGDTVTGSYGYLGPDGLYRHVEYVADINGFRAKIRTSEPGTANDNPSNVQIDSNPILVLSNPAPIGPGVTPVSPYGGVSASPNPGSGFRRDGIRRPPERPPNNPNPNQSTYADRQPVAIPRNPPPIPRNPPPIPRNPPPIPRNPPPIPRNPPPIPRNSPPIPRNPPPIPRNPPPIPRIPDSSRGPDIDDRRPINVDQFNVNRGPQPDGRQPIKPNFESQPPENFPTDDTRGSQGGVQNGVTYADIPDNVIPYRGANPNKPAVDEPPREVPQFNDPRQNQGTPARDPNLNGSDRRNARPPYTVRIPSSRQPIRPSPQPYDRGYDRNDVRNGDQGSNNNPPRDRPVGRPDSRGYEVTTKGGSTKTPPQDMGFIEATKGPISPYRPENRFYDRPTPSFDDEGEYDDQFKRRQDDDQNIVISKPVFEDRDRDADRNREGPRKIGGFVRSRYNNTRPDSRNGVKTGSPPPTLRDSFNRTLSDSAFDANQGRRDAIDKKMRRPTKVFVTSGPINGIQDKRVTPTQGDNRSFGANDVQQRQQHNDNDYDNRNSRDGQQIGSDGFKGQTDRDRPLPPIQREEIPPQNVRPYYGARRDGNRESVPKRPQSQPSPSREPSPPYDPRDEPNHIQTPDEENPQQGDDDNQQPGRPSGPQVFQPLMPNHRPDRQPLPRRQDRPYRPRTQTRTQEQDRSYEEQQLEIQPYQTQNSASITSPVNTILTAYKPVDSLEEDKKPSGYEAEKPSLNTPLSPSSYIVTPFPVNETKIEIKPIIVSRADAYTLAPELYPQVPQMEVPKFGTRLYTPVPPIQQTVDEALDDEKVNQQKDYNYNNDGKEENYDQNDYQNTDQNNDQNLKPIENSAENPIDDQNPSLQQYDNIENDQYYAYYDDQTQDVDSKDSSKDVIFTQTTAHKSDENFKINSNISSPIEMSHTVMNEMNWHKYETGGQPLIQ